MDYATLKLIWWALLLFMMVGFIVMDGFDLGIACRWSRRMTTTGGW